MVFVFVVDGSVDLVELTVKVPGSCGELVQGTHRGTPYLITCPINLYTRVTITDKHNNISGLGVKSQAALKRTLDYLGKTDFAYGITLISELPIGKGMASSSADIAAVCFAVAAAYGVELTAPEVSRIAAGIEPTDGVFFENIIRLNHMTGECLETMEEYPRLRIAVFDAGGAVDTVSFHKRTDLAELSIRNERITDAALELIRSSSSPSAWAEAATKSSLANQSILPKKDLSEMIKAARERGALGVNVAHSGTVIGILFSPDTVQEYIDETANRLVALFSHLNYCETVELTSGGRIMEILD